jgi:hypothetical protein
MARQVLYILTLKATSTSVFREVFVGDNFAKAKPEYSRFLETIHEEDESKVIKGEIIVKEYY